MDITDEQIEALATEAGAHGDREQVRLCRLALASREYTNRLAREIKRVGTSDAAIGSLYQTPLYRAFKRANDAYRECARVISEGVQ